MNTKTIKVPPVLHREMRAMPTNESETERTIRLSISSDEPYKRYDYWSDEEYWEVLDHGPNGIDDERLKAGLPILFNHDRSAHLGRAQGYENDGHKCSVVAKFSDSPFAKEKFKDVQDGILVDASVGYTLVGEGVCTGAKDELPIYKFRFKIFEGSLVTIPADSSVGVNRQRDQKPEGEPREILIRGIDNAPDLSQKRQTQAANMDPTTVAETPEQKEAREKREKEEQRKRVAEGIKLAREREKEIRAVAEKFPSVPADVLERAIEDAAENDAAPEAFRKLVFEKYMGNPKPINTPSNEGNRVEVIGERTSIGAAFVRSKQYQEAAGRRGQGARGASMDFPGVTMLGARGKASLQQRAGWVSSDLSSVNIQVLPGLVSLGVQRLTVMDLLAGGTIAAAALHYPRENGFGTINGVAVTAGTYPRATSVGEAGLKPTWEPDLTTEIANVKKVAITTKVPDEMMSDFPAMQSYIDERLPYMVDLETEFQLLYGDGLGNNLRGVFTNEDVQSRAVLATDGTTVAESLRKGLTDISVGSQFEPTGYAFHPYDWETASLLKDSEGRLFAGGPFYLPFGQGIFVEMMTFWGKPVVVSTSVTYGRPLAGAWKLGAQYFIREGMRLETTNANEDDFRRNLICVRAEHRLALATYRPVAFLEFQNFPART